MIYAIKQGRDAYEKPEKMENIKFFNEKMANKKDENLGKITLILIFFILLLIRVYSKLNISPTT